MASLDGTPDPGYPSRVAPWIPAVVALVTITVVVVLGLSGHEGLAAVVAGVGATAGGVQVTVHIRR
ncbi:hypothetical protein GCM10009577_77510 [Streptomyces javensis]